MNYNILFKIIPILFQSYVLIAGNENYASGDGEFTFKEEFSVSTVPTDIGVEVEPEKHTTGSGHEDHTRITMFGGSGDVRTTVGSGGFTFTEESTRTTKVEVGVGEFTISPELSIKPKAEIRKELNDAEMLEKCLENEIFVTDNKPEWFDDDKCIKYKCTDGFVNYEKCPEQEEPEPHCHLFKKPGRYPDCCPELVCTKLHVPGEFSFEDETINSEEISEHEPETTSQKQSSEEVFTTNPSQSVSGSEEEFTTNPPRTDNDEFTSDIFIDDEDYATGSGFEGSGFEGSGFEGSGDFGSEEGFGEVTIKVKESTEFTVPPDVEVETVEEVSIIPSEEEEEANGIKILDHLAGKKFRISINHVNG